MNRCGRWIILIIAMGAAQLGLSETVAGEPRIQLRMSGSALQVGADASRS